MFSDEVELLLPLERALVKDLILVLILEEEGLLGRQSVVMLKLWREDISYFLLDTFELFPIFTATYINVSSLNLWGGWIGAVIPPIVELAKVGKGSTLTSGGR